MKPPRAPGLDTRRTAELSAELRERAQAWIPSWGLDDSEGDFGGALLEIAARFSAEVTERFDGAGEKMRRGQIDSSDEQHDRPSDEETHASCRSCRRRHVLCSFQEGAYLSNSARRRLV